MLKDAIVIDQAGNILIRSYIILNVPSTYRTDKTEGLFQLACRFVSSINRDEQMMASFQSRTVEKAAQFAMEER